MSSRLNVLIFPFVFASMLGCRDNDSVVTNGPPVARSGPVYVTPDQDLQAALDAAASATVDRRLILKPGVYQTAKTQFCLLAVTSKHDGLTVEGLDGVVLSARSPDNPNAATVSHVIYCGDGITQSTVFRNLTITGANGMATNGGVPVENYGDRAAFLKQGLFFFMDGGAVKIFGQSSPVFERVDFVDNLTQLCGGAVSIEQQGFQTSPPMFRDCRFLRNRCPATGAAVDVLQGSSVSLENCLFVDNIGNYGMTEVQEKYQLSYNGEHGSGALTVFPGSKAMVNRCTFVGNWNAVDDRSESSRYVETIFAANDASDGSRPGHPYELDIINAGGVEGCIFYSEHPDLQRTVSSDTNILTADDPQFGENYVPANPLYGDVGFRP